jgi:signal transduction histidine kinase/ActR/RegA family two-component response regulator
LTQAIVFYENARLHEEARRHATVLEQEIAERKQAERERAELLEREQAARKDAETANRLKDEFLANVSHELRAPLNAILGWITLVRNGSLNEFDKERALETVERNAHAQKRLIDDLLDVSRIITGKLHLDLRLVDLVTIVESAVESGRPAAESKGVNLQTRIELKTCPLQGDSSRLQQVMWNLISNAIKFTPTGGRVEVRIRHSIDHVEVMVKDTGVGIPQHFLPYVFDRFRQADGSSTRNYGGMGLGLAIVRHLVEMHGGFVRADSEGKGLGATFTITLPLSAASIPLAVMPLTGERYYLSDSAPKLTGVRVLVVDDEADTRELLEAILSQCEAEVRTAGDVTSAVQIMRTWHAEVVISDLSMPLEDGYSLIEKLRQVDDVRDKPIPAIAVTARSGAESRIRALAAGFQMYLEKPVEPDELIVCVASLTGRLSQAQSVEN